MEGPSVLLAWVGKTDLRAPGEGDSVGLGPVAQAVAARWFEHLAFLSNFPKAKVDPYVSWISARASCRTQVERCGLSSPTEFGEIYTAAVNVLRKVLRRHGTNARLTFHLSPGTPAMAATWILLAKTRLPAELIESSREHGVRTASVPFDAATNRPLLAEVNEGRFREDLFHRLAVAILRLPPLRERREDLPLLIGHFLEQVNREGRGQPGFVEKKISAGARKLLLRHPWPGNVRELPNTLARAVIWTPDDTLKPADIREALLPLGTPSYDHILDRPLGEGLDLPALLGTVARHYLERALEETAGNKTRAAQLVGLPSYQTLTNWMKRYGVRT